jgi:hypothetical protein
MSFIMTSDNTQNFTVTPDGVTMFTLSGTVKDAAGDAVVGATMRYMIGTVSYTLRTDANGYSISAPSGSTITIIEIIACTTEQELPMEFLMTNDIEQDFIITSMIKCTLTSSVSQESWGYIEYYDGSGWSVLPSSIKFFKGDIISLRSVAYEGYGFSYWSGSLNGTDAGTITDPRTLLMDSDKTIGAVFYDTRAGYNFTLTADESMVNGVIMWSVDGTIPFRLTSAIFPVDTVVKLEAVGNPNTDPLKSPWMFSYWTGALGGNENPENIKMDGHYTVGAVFYDSSDPSKYFRLYLDGPIYNGKIVWSVGSGIKAVLTEEGVVFPVETNVVIEAVANDGYRFSHWTDSEASARDVNSREYSTSNDLGINAAFIEDINNSSLGLMVWAAILLLPLLALLLLLLLTRAKYMVMGTVTHNGEGLEGVTLEYIMNGKNGTAVTSGNGHYTIHALAGSEVIIADVKAKGYTVSGTMPKELMTEKTTRDVNFEMEKMW